ncbi:T9SS type A sorting domain-containing protein [Flavobacterium sp.]|uniref:T9SS type A sorting domain-containing protein n=1 Tax=Flavobacterium sp. TaxID=239 RepID=UPI003751E902
MKINYLKKNILLLFCSLTLISLNGFAQIYSNGEFSTGSVSKSGVNAPAGYTWSEMQNTTGNTTQSNATAGFPAYFYSSGTTSYRLADNFIVPTGQTWEITSFDFFGYVADYIGATIPIDQLKIQIFNVNPSSSGATPIAGNMTINALDVANSSNAFVYRIGNSLYPSPGQVTNSTRRMWKFKASINASLPSGTYWVEFQAHATTDIQVFFPPVTTVGSRGVVGANAKINVVASTFPSDVLGWSANLIDSGTPTTAPDFAQEIPFLINGTTLGVNQNELESKIILYPNPVKNTLYLSFSDAVEINNIQVYDIYGRLIKEFISDSQLDVSNLKSGNYILKIQTYNGDVSKLFSKE